MIIFNPLKRTNNNLMSTIKTTKLFNDFFHSDKAGGILLVTATIISLFLSNSPFHLAYQQIWNFDINGHSTVHWINDGLMAIFFLLIGLELEREIYIGELSSIKNASLPIFGALGGMLVPASIFFLINFGKPTQIGAGIPMATDIAFAIGILSLLGDKVPASLKVFLTALAVIDDLGAIIIIAVFYTKTIIVSNLAISLGIFAVLLILNRLKVTSLIPYLIGGVIMWYFMLNSGVHATITGVLLAFAIPFGNGDEKSSSYILQDFLHKPVAFFILPLFALANTAFAIDSNVFDSITSSNGIGILCGLLIGKPLGIVLMCFIGSILGLCSLPAELTWRNIFGAGFLGGIGFTMSIFITLLAYEDIHLINDSKIAILIASFIAAIIGFTLLRFSLNKKIITEHE